MNRNWFNLIYFILIFLFVININALEWCEEQNKNKIVLKCFEDEKVNDIDCQRKHFHMKEKKIIFDENIKRENVVIDCESEFDSSDLVFGENGLEKVNENGKNLTLKGEWGMENCGISQCWECLFDWGKCTKCNNNGYYLNNYISTSYGYQEFSSCTTSCPAGKYHWTSYSHPYRICKDCGNGKYSIKGSTSCSNCPARCYGNCIKTSGNCEKCVAGWYYDENAEFKCAKCSAGTYSEAQSTKCTTCGKGTYSSAGASECTKCSAGTYNPNTGSKSSTDCK